MMAIRRAAPLLLALTLLPGAAGAHQEPYSHLELRLEAGGWRLDREHPEAVSVA